jgi:integration host factor subunit beta
VNKLTKADIVEQISEQSDLNKKESFIVVDLIIDNIKKALSEGDKIELRGFGSFKVKKRNERKARNPRTGETVNVPAKLVPYFKASKSLKEKVNSQG